MTWIKKLDDHEKILMAIYRAIGNSGHGKLTVIFHEPSNKIEIIPEPYIREISEYEKFKTSLK